MASLQRLDVCSGSLQCGVIVLKFAVMMGIVVLLLLGLGLAQSRAQPLKYRARSNTAWQQLLERLDRADRRIERLTDQLNLQDRRLEKAIDENRARGSEPSAVILTEIVSRLNSLDRRLQKVMEEKIPPAVTKEIEGLKKVIRTTGERYELLKWLAGLIAAIVAVGTAWQIFWNWLLKRRRQEEVEKSERSASKRDRQISRLLQLYAMGEKQASVRANEQHNILVTHGAQTVTLVNETLELAKRASEHAVNAQKTKVKSRLDDLDSRAKALLANFVNQDNREIVNRTEYRDELNRLIDKFEEVESSNGWLHEPYPLTPHCLFIKAMQHFIEEQFDLSIEVLQEILNRSSSEVALDLQIRCRYWIAYERNNIAQFPEAERNFASAIELAKKSGFEQRALLLRRLQVETMLFETNNASELIDDVERIIEEYKRQGFPEDENLAQILLTKGNVLYASAFEAHGSGDTDLARKYLGEAIDVWAPLIGNSSDAAQEQYALAAAREWAFAYLALNENADEALDLLKNKVYEWAERQVRDRIGARYKAYHTMTLLMIAIAMEDEDLITSLDGRLQDFIGLVHKRAMIYSPIRKRNVSRDEFSKDVNLIQEKGLPRIS